MVELTHVIAASLIGIVLIFFVIALSLHKIERALTGISEKLILTVQTETPVEEKGEDQEKDKDKSEV